MRKLSEIKGKDALDVLADVMGDISAICVDSEFEKVRKNSSRIEIVQYLLRSHGEKILHIMAVLDGADPETYEPSLLAIPAALLELVNDEDLISLFRLGGTVTSSVSAMENTGETGKESSHS